jgi:hypothetical protein
VGIRRVAGFAGVAFVVLVVFANLAQGAAGRPFDDPSSAGYLDDYLAFYSGSDWVFALLAFVSPLVWLTLAVFAVGTAARLVHDDWRRPSSAWAALGVVGVCMQNAIFTVVTALDYAQFQLVENTGAMGDGLHFAHEALFELNSTSLAIALVGFSIAMLDRATVSRWLPRVGLTGAALLLVSVIGRAFPDASAALGLVGLLGFISWLVFIGWTGLWLVRGEEPRPAESRTTADSAT